MASYNKVMLLGNLGQDPEIKTLNNGDKLCNLSIATSESWKDKSSGERKERTQWHRVVVWNDGLVGVIEKHLAKGDQIMVIGQLEHRKWEDQSGATKYATEVVLRPFRSELQIIRCKAWDKKNRNGGDDGSQDYGQEPSSSPKPAAAGSARRAPDDDDEIPF